MVARRCSAKQLFWKFLKIHRETPVRQSLSNTVKSFHAATLATFLKEDLLTRVSEEAVCRSSGKKVFLNNLQNSQESTWVRVFLNIV